MNSQTPESSYDGIQALLHQKALDLRRRYAVEHNVPFEHTVADFAPGRDGMTVEIIIREVQADILPYVLIPPPYRQGR